MVVVVVCVGVSWDVGGFEVLEPWRGAREGWRRFCLSGFEVRFCLSGFEVATELVCWVGAARGSAPGAEALPRPLVLVHPGVDPRRVSTGCV